MALKKISKRVIRKAPPTRKGEILTIEISGTTVRDYNHAVADKKAAEELMKELAPELREEALVDLIPLNCADPSSPITSIILVDDREEAVRVSFTSKYNNADPLAVEGTFMQIEKQNKGREKAVAIDINDYVVETLVAKFNSKVFLNKDGDFSKATYDKFRLAIEAVAEELDVECPLSTEKVVMAKPDFHQRRWHDFTAAQQVALSEALPNTITLTPVVALTKPK